MLNNMLRFKTSYLNQKFPNPISKAMLRGLITAIILQGIFLMSGTWASLVTSYSARLEQLHSERSLTEDNLTQMYTRTIETTILLLENAAARIAPNPEIFFSRNSEISRIFRAIPNRLEIVNRLILMDQDGNLVLDSDPEFSLEDTHINYYNEDFFYKTVQSPLGSAQIGSPKQYIDSYVFTISSPIYASRRNPTDPPIGVITAFVDPLGQKFNLQRPNLERLFRAFMVDQNNLVLSSWPNPEINHGQVLPAIETNRLVPLRNDFSVFLYLEQITDLSVNDWLTLNPLLLIFFTLIILGTFTLEIFLIRNLARLNEYNRQALETKDILIKEIHHRVRNNLQIIASLLHLQLNSEELNNPKNTSSRHLLSLLETTLYRIYTISQVHDVLYSSREMEAMDLKKFIDEHLSMLQGNTTIPVMCSVKNCLFEEIYVPLELSVPLGIMINEILNNSLTHGFNEVEHSTESVLQNSITIILSCEPRVGKTQIIISDNGKGFDPHKTYSGLGIELIRQLEQQIKGKCTVESSQDMGTKWTIDVEL